MRILQWEGLAILVLVAGVVLREATGRRAWWRGVLRAEEMQLMVVTVVVSARMVLGVVTGPDGVMPGVGLGWLVLLGLSGGVYGMVKGLKTQR